MQICWHTPPPPAPQGSKSLTEVGCPCRHSQEKGSSVLTGEFQQIKAKSPVDTFMTTVLLQAWQTCGPFIDSKKKKASIQTVCL